MILSTSVRRRLSFPVVIGAILSLLPIVWTYGQDDPSIWGSKICKVTELDFGSVPKGAETSIKVPLTNVFKEDIQITGLTQAWRGLRWREATQLPISIPSGQERLISLCADAIVFRGEHKSRVMIALLDPVHSATSEINLLAKIRIRDDLAVPLDAGSIGIVQEGTEAEHKIELRYTGPINWQLLNAKVANPNLDVTFTETSREEGSVVYQVVVTVRQDASKGVFYDRVVFESNEAVNSTFSIPVEGKVEPEIAATDADFGKMHSGMSKTINIIVRALRPIEILGVDHHKRESSTIDEQTIQVKFNRVDASPVHVIPITLTAPDITGAFEEEFFVRIAGRPEPLRFKARGRVAEQAGAAKQ
jgi:hypothetical protein